MLEHQTEIMGLPFTIEHKNGFTYKVNISLDKNKNLSLLVSFNSSMSEVVKMRMVNDGSTNLQYPDLISQKL